MMSEPLSRQSIIQQAMQLPDVQQAIQTDAEQSGQGIAATTHRAHEVLDGIAANMNSKTISFLTPCFGWLWRRLYHRVDVIGLENLGSAATVSQPVYLPCHRSHMDYLLLAWVLHDHGIPLPYVAAGDNLNLPLIGPVLQRCGAVFMRRRFRGDALYSALFKGYLLQLSRYGLPLEFFPEGGRSRTGRLLPPRTGLLSMLLDNQQQLENTRLLLVPVWINYDQIPEIPSYIQQLKGQDKHPETVSGVVKSLRLLTRKLGSAQLVFGAPIEVSRSQEVPSAVELGERVLRRINQSATLNQSGLLAPLLLHQGKAVFSRSLLEQHLMHLHQLLYSLPGHCGTLAAPPTSDWINEALRRQQLNSKGDRLWLTPRQAAEMAYYRNTVVHILILPGLYLLLAHRLKRANTHHINRIIRLLYPFLQAELFLPWEPERLTQLLREIRTQLVQHHLLSPLQGHCWETTRHPLVTVFQKISEQVLLRYYIVLRLLDHDCEIAAEDLIFISKNIARRLQQEYGHPAEEYADSRVLQSFIDQLIHQGLLVSTHGRLQLTLDPSDLLSQAELLLPSHLLSLIKRQFDLNQG